MIDSDRIKQRAFPLPALEIILMRSLTNSIHLTILSCIKILTKDESPSSGARIKVPLEMGMKNLQILSTLIWSLSMPFHRIHKAIRNVPQVLAAIRERSKQQQRRILRRHLFQFERLESRALLASVTSVQTSGLGITAGSGALNADDVATFDRQF